MLCAAAPPVSIAPARPSLAAAADQYRLLWQAEGARIAEALEAATGLSFPEIPIEVLIVESVSMTAFDGRSMWLRASRSADARRAVLVHEMGHRLALILPRPDDRDDHRLLYLFLYDVWTDLYGQDFADRMLAIERRSSKAYDYDAAWTWALAMTRAQRQARLQAAIAAARSRASLAAE